MLNNAINRGSILLLSQHDNKNGHASIVQAMQNAKGIKVGYIASEPDLDREYYSSCKCVYQKIGFEMNVYLELEDEYDEPSVEALFDCDAIHLSGGDTFRFLKALKNKQLMHRIDEYNLSGGIVIGVSAGAMVLTPSIESAFICGDKNTVNMTDLTGGNLVDFCFVPHVNRPTDDCASVNMTNYDFYFCSDQDGVFVENAQLKSVGVPIKINANKIERFVVKIDDLSNPKIGMFLEEHLDDMKRISPPECVHALDLESLKAENVTFWTMWDDKVLVGCGALKKLNETDAEIKSMRTSGKYRNKGLGSKLLKHIENYATLNGINRLNLETGSMPFFEPAHRLYLKNGFVFCGPFFNYKEDLHSRFMTKKLQADSN